MIRIIRGKNAKNKRKKILKKTHGFTGSNNRLYSSGRQTLLKSQIYSYNSRKTRKRLTRKLWIVRINAFLKISDINYNQFINKIKKDKICLNRKVFSQLSLYDRENLRNIMKK